jgi:hypothetical protein
VHPRVMAGMAPVGVRAEPGQVVNSQRLHMHGQSNRHTLVVHAHLAVVAFRPNGDLHDGGVRRHGTAIQSEIPAGPRVSEDHTVSWLAEPDASPRPKRRLTRRLDIDDEIATNTEIRYATRSRTAKISLGVASTVVSACTLRTGPVNGDSLWLTASRR